MAVTRALRVAVGGLLPLPPPPLAAQRRPARGARPPWPTLAHLQRPPHRTVSARAKKLTGVGTDQLKHEGSGGATVSHGSGNGGGNGGSGGSGGGGGNGDDGHDDPRRALALDTIKWLAIAAAVAAALVAALPYALSHPLGLSATLALANLALPDDVSIQVDRVDASWHSPLALHGLRLVERSGGSGGGSGSSRQGESPNSAPFDPSSSDEEEEEEEEEAEGGKALHPLTQMAAGAQGTAAGGSGAGMLRRRRRGERPAAAAEVAGGVSVPVGSSSSSSSKRRRVLVSVERISVAQSLWQLLTGSAAQAVIGKPVIDCTLAPSGEPRLLAVLQAVGAAPRAHAMPTKEQQHQPPGSKKGGGGGGSGSGGSGSGPVGGDGSRPEQQGQQAGGAAVAAATPGQAVAAAAKQRQGGKGEGRGKDASDSDSDEEEAPTLAQAAMAAAAGQAAAQQRRAGSSSKSSGSGSSGSSGSKSSSGGSKPADSSSKSSGGSSSGGGGDKSSSKPADSSSKSSGGSKPADSSSSSGSGSGGRESSSKPADSGKQQAAPVAAKPGKAARFGAAAAAAAGAAAAAAEAAEAAVRKEIARQRESSDSEDEEAPTLAQAARAARQHSGRGNGSSSGPKVSPWSPAALLGFYRPPARKPQAQQAQQQAQQQAEAAGGGGGRDAQPGSAENNGAAGSGSAGHGGGGSGGGGGGKGQSWLPESLQHASSAVAVTGEVNAGKLQLCVSDGALLVPLEVRELLGKHLHLEVLQGAAAIEEAAADDQAASALGGGSSSSSSSSSGSSAGGGAGGSGGGSNGRKKLKWVRQRPAVLLPWGTGMPQTPVQVRLDGELMNFRLEGWQTARGFVLLVRPIEASMQFTPALSRYLLTMAHPALGGTVGMKGNTTVKARLTPHDMLLPAKQATLRVEPLSVELGESPVLRQTVGVLGEVVGKLRVGGSVRAELSPIQATLGDDGQMRAERLDIRVQTGLGPWKQGLHLVSWGTANLQPPQSLDATLCVPGDALKGLGLPELPDGAGLPLHISGTPTAPKIEIGRASRDLALLVGQVATQQASALLKSKGGPQWLADKIGGIAGGTQARGVQMPPPLA